MLPMLVALCRPTCVRCLSLSLAVLSWFMPVTEETFLFITGSLLSRLDCEGYIRTRRGFDVPPTTWFTHKAYTPKKIFQAHRNGHLAASSQLHFFFNDCCFDDAVGSQPPFTSERRGADLAVSGIAPIREMVSSD